MITYNKVNATKIWYAYYKYYLAFESNEQQAKAST